MCNKTLCQQRITEFQYLSQLQKKNRRKGWIYPTGIAVLELKRCRRWNPQKRRKSPQFSLKEFCWTLWWHCGSFQRGILSTVKLLRGINKFGEIQFESGHFIASTPTAPPFRCAPFPVLELQMAINPNKTFYYAMLQTETLPTLLGLCFCRACTI